MTLRTTVSTVIASIATSIIALTLVPAFAFADVNSTNCTTSNHTWWSWNNSSTNCTSGNLLVYVQVLNNANNGQTRSASDFTVSVVGSATPSNFVGSLSGTAVSVNGAYSVQVLPLSGYNATYSQGCSGTVLNNSQATCIVAENNSGLNSYYPNSYYPNQVYSGGSYGTYYSQPLTCTSPSQTVSIGQSVTFYAQGGNVSQFNWYNSATPNNKSYNIGRTYTTTLLSPGQQSITVTNGEQYATCNVSVVGYPIAGYPYQNNNAYNNAYNYPGGVMTMGPVTVTPTYIPRLPNTGFGPQNGAALAFVIVFLLAAAFAIYPYARKAFAIVLR